MIGCVDSDALNGTITKIPFHFRHYKIDFVALNVDGRQIPAKRYNPTLKTEVILGVIWDMPIAFYVLLILCNKIFLFILNDLML